MGDKSLFVTQGMLIIDDIIYQDEKRPASKGVLGGAGTYALMGARLFNPAPLSRQLKWIVDAGNDFPELAEEQIRSWDSGVIWRNDPSRKTTRGLNTFGDKEYRAFEYLAPRKRIVTADLLEYKLYNTETMHLICSPERCMDILLHISQEYAPSEAPIYVWEPVPDTCIPENLPTLLSALKYIQILSPNEQEFLSLLGVTAPLDSQDLSPWVLEFTSQLQGNEALEYLVIRRGELGVEIFDTQGRLLHSCLPYYYKSQEHVVDPTGAGNCFLGGFAAGYIKSGHDLKEATLYGTIAASYAIEQIGLPTLSKKASPSAVDSLEEWNGECVFERLEKLRSRHVDSSAVNHLTS